MGKREESGAIPAPAPHPARDEDAFIDPRAGPKAVARARARRRARLEHQQELKRARIRFLPPGRARLPRPLHQPVDLGDDSGRLRTLMEPRSEIRARDRLTPPTVKNTGEAL